MLHLTTPIRTVALIAIATALALTFAGTGRAAHNLTSWVSQGGNGNYHADFGAVSTTGDRVIFSTDERLVSADQDSTEDVYERAGGVTTLISTSATAGVFEGIARALGESADGTRVVFETNEALAGGDNDNATDLYLRANGVTTLVSTSTGPEDDGSVTSYTFIGISPDGSKIYFYTGQKLDAGDNDGGDADVYVRSGNTVTLLSAPTAVVPSDSVSTPVMSADGNTVFFSTTEKLDAADTDASVDIYKSSGGAPVLVSNDGATPDIATFAGATPDGTHVYFTSTQEVVAGDTDGKVDIYESFNGTISLISTGPNASPSNEDMTFNAVSDDGSAVFFTTKQDLVDGDNDDNGGSLAGRDVYRRKSGVTTILTDPTPTGDVADLLDANANFNSASADGTRVYFDSGEQLVDDDGDSSFDIYVNSNDSIERMSKGDNGTGNGANTALFGGVSADGSRFFFSTSEALVTPTDNDGGAFDLYMRSGGVTELVSTGPGSTNAGYDVFDAEGMTPDGSLVFFQTEESLISDDSDTDHIDIYARTISSVGFDAASSAGAESAAPAVTVSLNAPQYSSVQVNYAVTGGTAGVADYTLAAGTLMFAEGETSKTLPLTIANDSTDEDDETIAITLSSPSNAVLGTAAVHTYTIQDNDTATIGFRSASSSVTENGVIIALDVDLLLPSSKAASVHYAVSGGSAKNGLDYTLAAGTLAFPAGTTTKSIPVSILEDNLVELDETFKITLTSPTGLTLGPTTTHTVTILNDDSGTCHGKKATIVGTNAAETLTGTTGNDVIVGKGGNDTIKGLGGKDLVCAGGGKDSVNGGGGDDILYGEGGNDAVTGGKGNDSADGGSGDDTLKGESGKDKLTGQAGKDRLSGGPGAGDSCNGGPGADTLLPNAGCETVAGVP